MAENTEDLKSEESEEVVDTTSNHEETEDTSEEESFEELFSDDDDTEEREEKEKAFLENLNKLSGKKFKSLSDAAKSIKQADKLFVEQGRKKKEDAPAKPVVQTQEVPAVIKSIYFNTYPESKLVWKDVEKAARLTGRDPFELYESEKFFQEKAAALYEAQNTDEVDKKKVKDPSAPYGGKGGDRSKLALSEADRALLKHRGLTEKDVK